jgi:hypothetical protein
LVANDFAFDVKRFRESDIATNSCDAKIKLVDAKLEMVCAGWLFQHSGVVRRFAGSVVLIVFSAVKSTDVYKDALTRAKAHPAVIEALGSPVTDGFLVSGNTNVNGASGETNLSIPVSGPKGKGTIYVAATKSLGRWNYSGLTFEIAKTHQRIDILQGSATANPP